MEAVKGTTGEYLLSIIGDAEPRLNIVWFLLETIRMGKVANYPCFLMSGNLVVSYNSPISLALNLPPWSSADISVVLAVILDFVH